MRRRWTPGLALGLAVALALPQPAAAKRSWRAATAVPAGTAAVPDAEIARAFYDSCGKRRNDVSAGAAVLPRLGYVWDETVAQFVHPQWDSRVQFRRGPRGVDCYMMFGTEGDGRGVMEAIGALAGRDGKPVSYLAGLALLRESPVRGQRRFVILLGPD